MALWTDLLKQEHIRMIRRYLRDVISYWLVRVPEFYWY